MKWSGDVILSCCPPRLHLRDEWGDGGRFKGLMMDEATPFLHKTATTAASTPSGFPPPDRLDLTLSSSDGGEGRWGH